MPSVSDRLAEQRRQRDLPDFFFGSKKRAAVTVGVLLLGGVAAMAGWRAWDGYLNDAPYPPVHLDKGSYAEVGVMGAGATTVALYLFYKAVRYFRPMQVRSVRPK